ncbi:MAG: ATP-binding protein [Tepidisphaerales bacterium]
MAIPLRVLVLEDRVADSELVLRALREADYAPDFARVDNEAEYLLLLASNWDVILADYSMPQFNAPRALALLQERNLDIPFLVVTGSISEEVAVECMKRGAADYLLKDRLTRLGPAVRHALEARRVRQQQRLAEREAMEYQRRLQALASELARAEDRQRRQLATALHDGIGQILFSAAANLVSLQDRAPDNLSREALAPTLALLDKAIRDTRELTFELYPPVLYELGLKPALERLAQQFQARNQIACHLTMDGDVPSLDADMRGMLYQAVRELLANVVKHARAQTVQVNGVSDGALLILSVQDDGVGFDPASASAAAATPGGFGLFNIRERLRALGGRLDIVSSPGQGCRITLLVPLGKREQA